nr:MAG TPA: hypothetical protein [Caudoviricetes sp.]
MFFHNCKHLKFFIGIGKAAAILRCLQFDEQPRRAFNNYAKGNRLS